jgi:hypothetical protein
MDISQISQDMLRPMEESDVKVGQRYYGKGPLGYYTNVVSVVIRPNAWIANDDSEYRLADKFVLKN